MGHGPWVFTRRSGFFHPPSAAVRAPRRPPPSSAVSGRPVAFPDIHVAHAFDPATTMAQVSHSLWNVVELLKNISGHGQETNSGGDPRVTERRRAIASLLPGQATGAVDITALTALHDNIKADVEWLMAADRRDYTPDGVGQFAWSKSDMSPPAILQFEFGDRVRRAALRAEELSNGKLAYFPVQDYSVYGLTLIADVEKRAYSMADALLQFRAHPEAAKTGFYRNNKRVDQVGPVLVAEQRMLLAQTKLGLDTVAERREYALLRELIASHPLSNVNSVFEARNCVARILLDEGKCAPWEARFKSPTAWILTQRPPGANETPYETIHHNFSRDTPQNIAAMMKEWIFPRGPMETRGTAFVMLETALRLARADDAAGARALIARIKTSLAASDTMVDELISDTASADAATVGDKIVQYLTRTSLKPLGALAERNISLLAGLYRAVCLSQPTAESLQWRLFSAGAAWPEVALVIENLAAGDSVGTLEAVAQARFKLRDAVVAARNGYERHELIRLDAELNRLTCQELGAAVNRLGHIETDAQKTECLLALRAALQSIVASDLDSVYDTHDPYAQNGETVSEVLVRIEEMLKNGGTSIGEYRAIMSSTYGAVIRTVQNLRAYFDKRAGDVALGGTILDPEFIDQLVKQSGLHYATALAQKGMRVGLPEVVEPRRIGNVHGMRVLNSVGPVVFSNVVIAANTKDLIALKPPRDALAVVYHLEEKKMVAVGGVIVDEEHAPGGNSHLNMYAINNGIAVVALPELQQRYLDFFALAAREGGIYFDDSDDNVELMTVAYAKEMGFLQDREIAELRPGFNRRIRYLVPDLELSGFELLATHDVIINPLRATREVELYVPQEEVRGLGRSCVAFSELAQLGRLGRHLSGEKGLVLALLGSDPELSSAIPDGSIITTGRVLQLLRDAGVANLWQEMWSDDPYVVHVTDDNFLESAFYSDGEFRDIMREKVQKATRSSLEALLLQKDASGERLSAAGEALYQELVANPTLAASPNWIARSSFTGEDRPGKSGAGQYESCPNLRDPVSRIRGIIGVIESAWAAEPIDNNVADEINLQHIMPAVVVQHCLTAEQSGVATSRGPDGVRGRVNVQLVRGFGGGVEGGHTEEGVIDESGYSVSQSLPGVVGAILSQADMAEIRRIVLKIEQYFHTTIEPGMGHAVDVEFVRSSGTWKVVQARVVLLDKK